MNNNKVLFVCPRNGDAVRCKVDDCQLDIPHRVEMLARPDKPPVCETHKVALVRA